MTSPRPTQEDLFDAIREARPAFQIAHLGGGLVGLVASTPAVTVVITDEHEEVLVGTYLGDTWQTGEGEGDDPGDLAAILALVDAALV